MKPIEVEILDETSEQFLTDGDVDDVLDSFSREHLSPAETIDRLIFLRECARQRATQKVLNPEADNREDDEHATNPGAA